MESDTTDWIMRIRSLDQQSWSRHKAAISVPNYPRKDFVLPCADVISPTLLPRTTLLLSICRHWKLNADFMSIYLLLWEKHSQSASNGLGHFGKEFQFSRLLPFKV